MLKKFVSVLLAATLIVTCMTFNTFAATEVKGGYLDDFESYTSDDIFAESNLWDYRTNTDTTTMCISSDASGNKYLDLTSVEGKDTILMTKNNLFNTSGKTTVNFSLKSLKATKETTPCAKVSLNIGKNSYILVKATYGKLYFPNDTDITSSYSSWNDVKVLVDNIAHTATVTAGGKSHVVEITEIVDSAVIRVQAVGANTVSIDNFMIADAFYYGDTYAVDEDFEKLNLGSVSGQTINGMKTSGETCMNILSDSTEENKYIKLSPTASTVDPVIYTSSKITSDRTIFEYDIKMDNQAGQFASYIRTKSGSKVYLMRYNMGTFTLFSNKVRTDINVCGEDFVSFKFCISNMGNCSVFVNGNYVTYHNYSSDVTGTDIRFQCNYGNNKPSDITTSAVSLDNIKMYTPPAVQLRMVGSATENVGYSDYIELESNNPMNTSTFIKDNITVNGSADLIEKISIVDGNYRLHIKNGLNPNSEYTVAIKDNKVKDFYDQYVSFSHTFTTNDLSVATELKNEAGDVIGSIADGKIKVVSTVSNSGEAWPGVIAFAQYRNGEMLGLKTFEITELANEAVYENIFDCEETDDIKVFVWKGIDNIYPIFTATEY